MNNIFKDKHSFFLALLSLLIISNILFSSIILSTNNFNFNFSSHNLLISGIITVLSMLILLFLVINNEQNTLNYIFAFVAPASVSFVLGYPILDEILIYVITLGLLLAKKFRIKKIDLKNNFINNKYYLIIIFILLIYAVVGHFLNGNIKNLRYTLLFSTCISFLLLLPKNKIDFNIRYLYLGFFIFFIVYIFSGFFHGIYFYTIDHSILQTFVNHYEIDNVFKSILSSMFVFGLLGPGGINGTEISIYLTAVVSIIFYHLSVKEKISFIELLILFISFCIVFSEDSRNILIAVMLAFILFFINSKKSKFIILIFLLVSSLFVNEFFKFRNIYTSEPYLVSTFNKLYVTSESFDLKGTILSSDPMLRVNTNEVTRDKDSEKKVIITGTTKLEKNDSQSFIKVIEEVNIPFISFMIKNRKPTIKKKEVNINKSEEVNINKNEFLDTFEHKQYMYNNIQFSEEIEVVKTTAYQTSKGDTSRFIHILHPIRDRIDNIFLSKYEGCNESNKLKSIKELLFGVWTYNYWPKNIDIIDCTYKKNEIRITRELQKSNNGIAEPPRVSTLAIFLSEYGLITTLLLILYVIKLDTFKFINNNRTLINYLPVFCIIFLGISTHIQDNSFFWIVIFSNSIRSIIIEKFH